MGVDTNAYWPNTSFRSVLQWVGFLAPGAQIEKGYQGSEEFYKIIHLEFKGEKRILHLHRTTIDLAASIKKYGSENVDDSSYIRSGLPDKSRGIMSSLECWGRAVEIMRLICALIGGYVDENDSDSEGYYWVDQDVRQAIRIVFEGAR